MEIVGALSVRIARFFAWTANPESGSCQLIVFVLPVRDGGRMDDGFLIIMIRILKL
jgi:hypothetical protein